MKPTKTKIEKLRKKYPEIDEYLTDMEQRAIDRNNEHYDERKELEDKVRNLESDLRLEKIKRAAVEKALHHEFESFWRRAVSVAEQY